MIPSAAVMGEPCSPKLRQRAELDACNGANHFLTYVEQKYIMHRSSFRVNVFVLLLLNKGRETSPFTVLLPASTGFPGSAKQSRAKEQL